MERPISFWGYKEQETRLILHEHDDDDDDDEDDDDDDEYPIGLNGQFGTADAIVRRMKGGSACHVAGNTIKIRVNIIRSAPT